MKDIIIFSGQSNMQGQTEAPMSQEIVPKALEYRLLIDELIPLCHPVGEDIGNRLFRAHQGNGSLIPDFCSAYIDETKIPIVAVHAAKGATRVDEWLPLCERFNTLAEKCRNAINKVGKKNIGKIWFVWLQGESDALNSTTEEQYKERLKVFKSSLEKELGIDGFFIIRVGKFTNDRRDIAIIKAQEKICKTQDFTLLTRITGECTNNPEKWLNPQAPGHYNNAAMELIGKTAGKNLGLFRKEIEFSLEAEAYPEVKI